MHEVILELAEDGKTVRFAESKHELGKWGDAHVNQTILALPYDALSGDIARKIYVLVPDSHCCPRCGAREFGRYQRIAQDIEYGYCKNCMTTIHTVADRWISFPELPPYRRVLNTITGEVKV